MKRIFKEMLAWILCVSMISGSGGAGIAGGLTTYAAVPVESVGNMASGSNAGKSSGMMDESGASLVLATADNAAKKQNTGSAEVEEIHLATASDALYGHRYLTSDGIEIRIETADSIWPDDTLVKVEKVTGTKQKQITDLVEKALTEDWGKVSDIFAYDISFWSEGEEFEPEGNVEVTFRFPENEKERFQGNAKIFHIKDEAKFADIMPNETETEESVSCLADEFSVYGVALVAESDYIPIYSSQELHDINHDLKGNYILMNDIDLSGWGTWEPIGNSKETVIDEFRGNFDGNGHTISNLRLSVTGDSENIGLFGKVRFGSVKNLTLSNVKVEGTATHAQYIGALAGYSNSVISSCRTDGNIDIIADRYDTMSRTRHIGGMTGYGNSGISDCVNDISIKIHQQSTYALEVGGIAGGNYSQIEKSINNGSIKMSTENSRGSRIEIGGIAGHGTGEVEQCANYGMIEAVVPRSGETEYAFEGISSTVHIGGIQGVVSKTVRNCYNAGDISLSATCKNMGKRGFASLELSVGGILGEYGKTETCYNIGQIKYNYDVQSPDSDKNRVKVYTGSIAGYQASGAGGTCYYYKGSHAIGVGKIGDDVIMSDPYTGLTNSQMQIQETYEEFDFTQIWTMGDEKYPYPIFQWQTEGPDVPYPPGDESDTLSIKDCSPWKDTSLYQNSDIEIVFDRDICDIPGENCEDRFEIRDYMSDTPFFQWNPEFKNYSIDGNVLTLYGALLNCTPGIMYYLHIPDGFFKSASDETDELTNCEDKGRFNFVLGFRDGIDSHFVEFKYKKDNKTILYFFKEVKDGELCQSAEPSVWNGYKFVDWYVDEYYSKPFDFTTPIHKNYTLYGKFIPDLNSYTESDSDGSSSHNIYSTNVRDSGFVNIHDPKTGVSLWQCVQNGKPITGYVESLYYNGIPGSFLFDENGFMLTGWQNVNGELRYFDETFGHRGYEIKTNDLTNMLNKKSAFGTLNSYQLAGTFVGDLNFMDATNFLIVNYGEVNTLVRKWILSGEDQTKVNEDWTRNYLKQIVNNLCDSQKHGAYFAINDANMKSSRTQMGILANLVKGTEYGSVAEMYEYLEKATGYAEEVLDGMFANYTSNICMLDKYSEICPEMRTVIQELKAEYTHSVSLNLKKTMIDKIVDEFGVKNIVNTYKNISGKTSGAGDILSAYSASNKAIESMISTLFVQTLQQNVKDLSTVSNVENVIYSAYTRTQVLNALKRAEEDLKANPNQRDALNNYVTAFEIAKEANKIQYWNMYEYYRKRGDTEKANLAYEGYQQLNSMFFNNY